MDAMETSRRMVREYGQRAESECDDRAKYHDMLGDKDSALRWRVLKQAILIIREKPDQNPD